MPNSPERRQPALLNDLQRQALKRELFGIYDTNLVVDVIRSGRGMSSSGTILPFRPRSTNS